MQVSLSDVAAKAGVSTATVSRVLNRKELRRIPESTRERVKQAASDLNYYPNRLARSLQSRRTMNIGVVVDGLCNPFFAELLDILEEMIVGAGYDVLPDTGHRMNRADESGRYGWSVDGVLMWAVSYMKIEPSLCPPASGVPVVYLGYERFDGADFVAQDSMQGTRLALDHLWDRGHRRIAMVSLLDVEKPPCELRFATYEAFCKERAIEPIRIDVVVYDDFDKRRQVGFRRTGFDAGRNIADSPASERPTAVFCYNDLIALGFMNGAMSRGLRVPEDIAVVGFDGIDEGNYQSKPLTTVVCPSRQICASALDNLLRRISNDLPEEPKQLILPMSLRTGATT